VNSRLLLQFRLPVKKNKSKKSSTSSIPEPKPSIKVEYLPGPAVPSIPPQQQKPKPKSTSKIKSETKEKQLSETKEKERVVEKVVENKIKKESKSIKQEEPPKLIKQEEPPKVIKPQERIHILKNNKKVLPPTTTTAKVAPKRNLKPPIIKVILEDNPITNPWDSTDRFLPESTDDYGITLLPSLKSPHLVSPMKDEKTSKIKTETPIYDLNNSEDLNLVGFKSHSGCIHRWEQSKQLKSKNIIVAPYVLTY